MGHTCFDRTACGCRILIRASTAARSRGGRGAMIAAAESSSPNVVLFELASGEARSWLPVHRSIETFAFSPDARLLAAGAAMPSSSGTWTRRRKSIISRGTPAWSRPSPSRRTARRWPPASADSTVLLWDIEKMRPRRSSPRRFQSRSSRRSGSTWPIAMPAWPIVRCGN